MPQNATIALIAAYYRAFNAGDDATFLSLLSDNIRHDINQSPSEHGKAAFTNFIAAMKHSYAEHLTDITILASEDGTSAAAEYVVHGKYLAPAPGLPEAKGQSYVLPGGAFFSIEHNKITRVTNYYNLEDWLAQVRG